MMNNIIITRQSRRLNINFSNTNNRQVEALLMLQNKHQSINIYLQSEIKTRQDVCKNIIDITFLLFNKKSRKF